MEFRLKILRYIIIINNKFYVSIQSTDGSLSRGRTQNTKKYNKRTVIAALHGACSGGTSPHKKINAG